MGRDLDQDGKFPKSIFEKACRLGWVGIDYLEEYGGQSFGLLEKALVIEEFCRRDSEISISINLADMASGIILRHGDEQQKKRFIMPLLEEKGINTVASTDSDLGPMASMARLFATDVAVRAAVDSIQIHGGYGFTEEYVISRFFREAKILEIGEGTNEIQHIVIARLLGC